MIGFLIALCGGELAVAEWRSRSVSNRWDSVAYFMAGHHAKWRAVEYEDGATEEGPLRGGKRHGEWSLVSSGVSVMISYSKGERQ